MDVRLPDGTVIQGVPEGISRADLTARLARNGYDVSRLAPKEAPPIAGGADPTSGMSTFDKVAAGAGKAVVDAGRGIAGLFTDNGADVAESRRLDAPLMNTGAGVAGNIAGNVGMALLPGGALKAAAVVAPARAAAALDAAGSALIAPKSLKGAAALGAGIGAAQPAVDTSERVQNALLGGGASAAGSAALNGLARVIKPQVAPGVNALMAEGVTPTPGQILGGGFKRAEEGLTSVPLIGDAIKRAQTRAVADINTAAFNRALSPVGDKLPAGMMGREAVNYVEDALSSRYNALLPKLTTEMDAPLFQDLQKIGGMMASGSIDPAKAQQFEKIVNNQVLAKFQPGANGAPTMTGETMKAVESDLGQLAASYRASPDPDQRLLGDALREVQDNLRDAVLRGNPQHAPELRKINEGYANFKRVQRAAAALGSEEGLFSPAQLQGAVKASDRSKDKAAFARGNALMQDLSEAGKSVLGNKVPDSGTPYRGMLAGASAGAVGGLVGLKTAGAALAAPLLYSQAGQNALAAALTKRPALAGDVSNALRLLSPYAAPLGAVGMTTPRP